MLKIVNQTSVFVNYSDPITQDRAPKIEILNVLFIIISGTKILIYFRNLFAPIVYLIHLLISTDP